MAKPKCERYWPEVNQSMKIGAIKVTTVSGRRREGEREGKERERERERGFSTVSYVQALSSFSLQLNEQNISNDFVIRDLMAECQGVSRACCTNAQQVQLNFRCIYIYM